jgi:hypothetical protein
MDPVTVGAVLLAIASGASEALGSRLWDEVVSLVRRPFRKAGDGASAAVAPPSGEAELAALTRNPDDRQRAMALAEVMLARAGDDADFGRELSAWWVRAEPVRASSDEVRNTISGGTQHGPVFQGRDFSNITFGNSDGRAR